MNDIDCVSKYIRLHLISAAILSAIVCGAAAGSQPAAPVTQRRINDYAAALERCRRALLVTPGLRKQVETLPAYISRVSFRLPGEDIAQYQERVRLFVADLEAAADSTALARTVPRLKDSSAANNSLWRRAARDLSYLPKRMVQVHSVETTAIANPDGRSSQALAAEILMTFQLVLDAYTNLRDARP